MLSLASYRRGLPPAARGRIGIMATGFNRSSASQFPPLPSSRSQSTPAAKSGVEPAASYSRAVTSISENSKFSDLEGLTGKVVTLFRSKPFSSEVSGRILFGDTPHGSWVGTSVDFVFIIAGIIGVVDQSTGKLCVFHTHSLESLQVLDEPDHQWTREESTGAIYALNLL